MNRSDSDDALVARLLELPAAERAAYWQRLCTERPALRDAHPEITRQVEANSGPARSASPFPTQAAVRAFEAALAPGDREMVGTQIGPYKLIQKIGEGGFGTVWMADQHEPLRRRVALKIIRAGLDTDEVIARFEVERQALALMDHPNIARVFDAGATASGRPYFVMELVRGVPITRYCDENRLTAGARLQLFLAVCSAVQHAHQKGIIHRDLKPSNILITLHDGAPVPKIIDFGIAKATDKELTEKTLVTQFHAFVGTPVYTSPEQMEMSGLDVDTRSDIYSLGVLLYELLAGRPPFDPEALVKSGLDTMRRTIREIDPPRPSHRLGTLTEADRTSVAHQRGTDAAKLTLLLRGDVDWIVMRCLEKDRTRRYETAAALATDIQHHLRHEPILARPPSELYRVKKFVRRHRVGVAALTAIAVLLMAGLVTASTLWMRERAAHRRAAAAEAAESELRRQAENARQLETKRAARTTLELAGQFLDQGRTADGLAQIVHAGRKDPDNPTVAPRLASILTTRNFLLPEGPPLRLPAPPRVVRHLEGGRWIVACCEDGTVAVITADTGELRQTKLPAPMALDGCVGETGSLLALLCTDHVIRVVDAAAAQVAREFRFGRKVIGHNPPAAGRAIIVARLEDDKLQICDATSGRSYSVAIADRTRWGLSPDQRWLVMNPFPWREIELRDTATGEVRGMLRAPAGEFHGGDISPDGRRAALVQSTPGDRPSVLRLWSLPEGRPLSESHSLSDVFVSSRPGASLPFSVFFSRNGRRLFVHGRTSIEMRDGFTGIPLAPPVPYGAAAEILRVFTPDNRLLLTRVANGVGVWDLEDFRVPSRTLSQESPVQDVKISEDSRVALVTSSDGFVRVWEIAAGQLLTEPAWQQKEAPVCSLSPDGNVVVLAAETGELLQFRIGQGAARPLSLPWDGQRRPTPFLRDSRAGVLALRSDHALALDVTTGKPLPGGFAYPRAKPLVAVSNNPNLTVDQRRAIARTITADGKEAWEVWEVGAAGVTRIVPLRGVERERRNLLLSEDGELVALSAGSELGVWRTRTGEPAGPVLKLAGLYFAVTSGPGAFSPDGRRLCVGGQRGAVRVWDIASGKEALAMPILREALVSTVRFSPDGARLLVGNSAGDARLFDAATGEPVSPVLSHPGPVDSFFAPDGRTVATRAQRTIRLSDTRSGEPRGEIREAHGVRTVAWSSDGTRLVKTSRDGPSRIWDVSTLQPVTDLMSHPGVHVAAAVFSPDSRFVMVEAFTESGSPASQVGSFDIWSIPPPLPPGATIPEWLLELATLFAGQAIDADGKFVHRPASVQTIEKIRRAVAALPAGAPYAEWGRWFFADRRTRSIAPGFTITPAEADKLAAELAPRDQPSAAVAPDAEP